jgi:hypothetical protein
MDDAEQVKITLGSLSVNGTAKKRDRRAEYAWCDAARYQDNDETLTAR